MIRVFISSVQTEFAAERKALAAFLRSDAGTGTSDMVDRAVAAGLAEPEFKQDDQFSVIIYRTSYHGSSEGIIGFG